MHESESILVSACLLGEACRYDGASAPCKAVIDVTRDQKVVPVCPEQLGGLPTPRTPSEIQPDGRVVDRNGVDRTAQFERGALAAVEIARKHGCTSAILKARSPSCGVAQVYDGTFTGTLTDGQGLAAAALSRAGLIVRDELSLSDG